MTRTLEIHVGRPPETSTREQRLKAITEGADVEPKPSRLTVESLETFGRIFRQTNLELLSAIVEHEPASIRELARLVDRHPPEVTENLHELADYGVVELLEDGRAKRPTVWYDELKLSGAVPLQQLTPDTETSVA